MKEKIKIIHLITKLELGGAQINTLFTFKNLDKKIFKTYLLSGKNGILNKDLKNNPNCLIIKNLIRPLNPVKDLLCIFELIKSLKKIKPDIIHTHSSKAGIIGRIAAWLCKVPIIIHSVHGYPFSPYQFFLKRYLYITIEKMVSKITSSYIFVSKSDLKTAKRLNLKLNNFQLIRSGFPFEDYKNKYDKKEFINQKYALRENQILIGIIAPLKPQKGLFHMIKVAQLVLEKRPDVIFFIAGDGKLRFKIEKELKKLRIFANFRLPGFLFNIPTLLNRVDIGLSTAIWEGLPQSLIQFRLKKIPLVVSNIPGNSEVVKDQKNGYLIHLNNHQEFADRLIQLIENPQLLRKLGDFANEDFTEWDASHMVQLQEELYKKLIDDFKEKKK